MEFDVCYFFVFLGVLRIFHRQQNLAYPIDILSSLYLLWATFARRFLLHNTQVALWGIDICSAIMSERRLIKDYLMVSLASWIASSILEYTSSVRFIMLFGRLTSGGNLEIRLSRSRKAVLLAALLCTINSAFDLHASRSSAAIGEERFARFFRLYFLNHRSSHATPKTVHGRLHLHCWNSNKGLQMAELELGGIIWPHRSLLVCPTHTQLGYNTHVYCPRNSNSRSRALHCFVFSVH